MPENKPTNGLGRQVHNLAAAVSKLQADARTSPLPDTHRFVSFGAFAEALGFSRTWPYELERTGQLRTVRIAGRKRIRYQDALAWVESELKTQ